MTTEGTQKIEENFLPFGGGTHSGFRRHW